MNGFYIQCCNIPSFHNSIVLYEPEASIPGLSLRLAQQDIAGQLHLAMVLR